MQVLNDILHEMDLIDVFETLHPNAAKCTLFSSAHKKLSRIDHILGHKPKLSKPKKTDIIWSIFSDHNAMKLDNNHTHTHTHTPVRSKNTCRLNNMFQNNEEATEEIKREI